MIKDFIVKLMKEANEEVADDEWKHRRRGTRSLGYAVACSALPRGVGELPARAPLRTLSQSLRTLLRSSTYAG